MDIPSQNFTVGSKESFLDQTIKLKSRVGPDVDVPLALVDELTNIMIVQTIGYGVEIGASIVMLAVILVMTPKTKFWRSHTYLNIAGLCNNIIRVILLAVYFESSWVTFYALYSTDYHFVNSHDLVNSIASTVIGVPQNIMIMSSLILQAWAMVRLWPRAYKWGIVLVSVVLVLFEIGFMGASQTYQIMGMFLSNNDSVNLLVSTAWVRYTSLAVEVSSICWFCLLFIAKLATHLYRNRSFLPTTKGLGAMDALVMTNGVLMLIPVFFVALQYSETTVLQAGSMVYTSVLIVLPLGSLVAQRISDPAAFNSERSSGARVSQHPSDRFEGYTDGNSKALLNPTWSQSDKDSAVFPGRRGSSNILSGKTGVISTITVGSGHKTMGAARSPVDIELASIDADLETGHVRVDHEIRQDVL